MSGIRMRCRLELTPDLTPASEPIIAKPRTWSPVARCSWRCDTHPPLAAAQNQPAEPLAEAHALPVLPKS